jgi:hemerythrin-like metal-binding protein
MEFFPWKEQYKVGISSIDNQHKRLVSILNELYNRLDSGKGKEAMGNTLSALIDYTKTHFSAEEGIMKLHDFPGYQEHKETHARMASHVVKLSRDFQVGEITSPIQIANFLKGWLSKHILETDKQYGLFLNSKGVR